MLSIWGIFRKIPLAICINWIVFFLLIQVKPWQEMTVRKLHLITSATVLFLSLIVGVFGWHYGVSLLLEMSIACCILSLCEYVYLSHKG